MEISKRDIEKLKRIADSLSTIQMELAELAGKYTTEPVQSPKTKKQLREEEEQRDIEKYKRRYTT